MHKKSVTSDATSQPESKSSEQSTEKAGGSLGDSKEGEKESGDGSSRLVSLCLHFDKDHLICKKNSSKMLPII
ncbi:hypothetical protein NQ314_020645 [Rhamnusium bicolor]|uniref:Uncharacterized protein n=1 Tax=Rhamnusium bicolor TaxID=1586634 RepID=A0AAV8WJ70_9CUCU|nr:hypothetical protein NQ314_020645 [Rhamnusium bicolor]